MKPAAYLVAAMLAACSATPAHSQAIPADSTFTYQGVLAADGQPVEGSVEMLFRLFQTPEGAQQVGPDIEMTVVPDAAGRFGAELDFGPVFGGDERYLEITILHPDGSPEPSTVLMPRTRLTAAPTASYAFDAPVPALEEVTDERLVLDDSGELTLSVDDTHAGLTVDHPSGSTQYTGAGIETMGNLEIDAGSLDMQSVSGLSLNASSAMELTANSDLTLDAGLSIAVSALNIDIDSQIETRIDGTLVVINSGGVLRLTAPSTQFTGGPVLLQGHEFSNPLAQINGALNVAGNAFKPGGGLWGALSDGRMKKHIVPLSGSLDTVRALRPVRFEYNNPDHPLYAPGVQHGFIAQEVRPVRPDWISADDEGNLMLTPRGFEAMIVGAMQELETAHRQQIEAIRTENDELRARLERLEALLSSKTGL